MRIYQFLSHTLFLLIAVGLPTVSHSQDDKIDSLLSAYTKLPTSTFNLDEVLAHIERLAANNPNKALSIIQQFESKSFNKKDYLTFALFQKMKAYAFLTKGDFVKSISTIDQAVKIIPQKILSSVSSQLLVVKATSLFYQSRFPEALEVYQVAERQAIQQKDYFTLYQIKNNLAGIYMSQNDLEKASLYLNETLQYYLQQNNDIAAAYCYNNLGIIQTKSKNYSKALSYFNKASPMAESEEYDFFKAQVFNNLGKTYYAVKNIDSSSFYYEKALAINTKIDNQKGSAVSKIGLSEIAFKKSNYTLAKSYAQDAFQKGNTLHVLNLLQESSEQLFKSFVKLGIPDSALHYQELSKNYADSILNSDNTRRLTTMQLNFEFDKKEAQYKHVQELNQIELQKQLLNTQLNKSLLNKSLLDQKIQQIELQNQKLLNIENNRSLQLANQEKAIAVSKNTSLMQENELSDLRFKQLWLYGIISLILLGAIFYIWWNKNRLQQLRIKNDLKEREASELLQRTKATESELKAVRAQMNPHFIFNVLNSIESYIIEEDSINASKLVQRFSKLSRLILENSTQSLTPLEREWTVNHLYLEIEQTRFNHSFEFTMHSNGLDMSKFLIPTMMIQPMVENAVHHGIRHSNQTNPLIEVHCEIVADHIRIQVKDNGPGLSDKPQSKPDYKQKSFGITSLRERIEVINDQNNNQIATFEITNLQSEQGCLAMLSLPIINPPIINPPIMTN